MLKISGARCGKGDFIRVITALTSLGQQTRSTLSLGEQYTTLEPGSQQTVFVPSEN